MSKWTCIAKCGKCGKELNRAEHVPAENKTQIMIGAPLIALCDEETHNTFSDLNLAVKLEWIEERQESA